MITYEILDEEGIVTIEPYGALSKDDFAQLTRDVDRLILREDRLHGLLIHSEKFPGWKGFGALLEHLRFVRDHHRKIEKVAICSDSSLFGLLPKLGGHFVNAEVREFSFADKAEALDWLRESG